MDFYSIKTSPFHRILCRASVSLDIRLYFLLAQRLRLGTIIRHRHVTRTNHIARPLFLLHLSARRPPQRPQLQVNNPSGLVHALHDFFPGLDLRVIVDTRDVRVAARFGGDEGRFGDDEGARDAGALGVVVLGEGELDVVVVGAEAG